MRSPTVRAKYPSSHSCPDHNLCLKDGKPAEQLPGTNAFDDPNHFPYRTLARKRQQDMDMLNTDFHLNEFKFIFLAYLADQLLCVFLSFAVLKDFFSIFRIPNMVIAGIINRMTRSFNCHAWAYIKNYRGLWRIRGGVLPLPLITPWVKERIHPRGKSRRILLKLC